MKTICTLTLTLTLILTACGGSPSGQTRPAAEEPSKISLSQDSNARYDGSNLALQVGEKVNGTYLAQSTWTSSNPAVARVSSESSGRFTLLALSAGTTLIRGTSGTQSAEMKVTVTGPVVTGSGVTVSPSSVRLTVGHSQTITASVQGSGNFNSAVSWSSSDPGIAVVDGAGHVTGVGPGSAIITARSLQDASRSAHLTVTVTAPPALPTISGMILNPSSVNLTVGSSQTITASVQGTGNFNAGMTWSSSNAGVATVDGAGRVVAVKAGSVAITATSVQDASKHASLAATVVPLPPVTAPPPAPSADPFNITLIFPVNSQLTDQQKTAFVTAANRWSGVISAGLPDVPNVLISTGQRVTVDDLVIVANGAAMDGPGGILGQAGPRQVRGGTNLPLWGEMQFDTADLASMEADGSLQSVILHEMGHVLGIGTLWDAFLKANATPCTSATQVQYAGTNALREYRALGGQAQGVPVEDQYGDGTKCGHWKESVFKNELMTGFSNKGPMPLSRITVGALADLGYSVNYAATDAYVIPDVSAQSVVPDREIKERLITPNGVR